MAAGVQAPRGSTTYDKAADNAANNEAKRAEPNEGTPHPCVLESKDPAQRFFAMCLKPGTGDAHQQDAGGESPAPGAHYTPHPPTVAPGNALTGPATSTAQSRPGQAAPMRIRITNILISVFKILIILRERRAKRAAER